MTFATPRNTLAPCHGPRVVPDIPDVKSTLESKAIYSLAPKSMGYGRPAQSTAGQP